MGETGAGKRRTFPLRLAYRVEPVAQFAVYAASLTFRDDVRAAGMVEVLEWVRSRMHRDGYHFPRYLAEPLARFRREAALRAKDPDRPAWPQAAEMLELAERLYGPPEYHDLRRTMQHLLLAVADFYQMQGAGPPEWVVEGGRRWGLALLSPEEYYGLKGRAEPDGAEGGGAAGDG